MLRQSRGLASKGLPSCAGSVKGGPGGSSGGRWPLSGSRPGRWLWFFETELVSLPPPSRSAWTLLPHRRTSSDTEPPLNRSPRQPGLLGGVTHPPPVVSLNTLQSASSPVASHLVTPGPRQSYDRTPRRPPCQPKEVVPQPTRPPPPGRPVSGTLGPSAAHLPLLCGCLSSGLSPHPGTSQPQGAPSLPVLRHSPVTPPPSAHLSPELPPAMRSRTFSRLT